ncbi:hypothetical protein TNCV_1523271 [Trichonephila clavipes]|nr:hypothetical protein TNCV_1523271 [Trichonephila clavipes]
MIHFVGLLISLLGNPITTFNSVRTRRCTQVTDFNSVHEIPINLPLGGRFSQKLLLEDCDVPPLGSTSLEVSAGARGVGLSCRFPQNPFISDPKLSSATANEDQGLVCPSQYTGSLGAEVHEQMTRSSGQSEARPPVFKSSSKLLIYRHTAIGRKGLVDLAQTRNKTSSCGVEALYATTRPQGFQ